MVLAKPLLRSQAIRLLDIMRQLQLMKDPRLMLMLLNLICSGLRIGAAASWGISMLCMLSVQYVKVNC